MTSAIGSLKKNIRDAKKNIRAHERKIETTQQLLSIEYDDLALMDIDSMSRKDVGLGRWKHVKDETAAELAASVNARIETLSKLPPTELDERVAEMIARCLIPGWKDKISAVTRELAASDPSDTARHEELRPQIEKLFTLTQRQSLAARRAQEADHELHQILRNMLREATRTKTRTLDHAIDLMSDVVLVIPTEEMMAIVKHDDAPRPVDIINHQTVKEFVLHGDRDSLLVQPCDRIYQNPGNYRSYAHPIGFYGRCIADRVGRQAKAMLASNADAFRPYADRFVIGLAMGVADWPLYWVGRDMLIAAMASDLPDDIDIADVKWPRDAMTFMLPLETLRDGNGYIEFLTIARHTEPLDEIDAILAKNSGTPKFCHSYAGFAFIGSFHSSEAYNLSTYKLAGSLASIPTRTLEARPEDRPAYDLTGVDFHKAQQSVANITKTAINLMLIMQARRELISGGGAIKKVKAKKKGQSRATLWSPLWIGKDYRFQTEKHSGEGTHASPRLHWRRGYWRNQAWGERHLLRRLRWIEPCLVNAKPKEDSGAGERKA